MSDCINCAGLEVGKGVSKNAKTCLSRRLCELRGTSPLTNMVEKATAKLRSFILALSTEKDECTKKLTNKLRKLVHYCPFFIRRLQVISQRIQP